MREVVYETIVDSLKLLPFLFLAFLLLEYFEHKLNKNNKNIIRKAGKIGPLIGSILGVFPQCGFSVAATNLYATRIISLGTLISIYLATSDEMLPILISAKAELSLIFTIIIIKLIVGVIAGFIIDFFIRKEPQENFDLCHDHHCDCNHGIIKSTIKHTLDIFVFILIISFILNIGFLYLGEETIKKLLLQKSIFGPFIASIIGLIPNCGSSVLITQLYLNHTISFASMISGLLTGSGTAILVLFKVNKKLSENIKIISMIYFIGVFVGMFLYILG